MSYSYIATKISDHLSKELNHDEEKRIVIAYAVDTIFLTIIGFVFIMAVGFVMGVPMETFIAALSGFSLRKASGGAHLEKSQLCILTGAVAYPLLGILAKTLSIQGYNKNLIICCVCLICFFIVIKYAPVDSKAKPIISIEFKKRLWRLSLLILLILSSVAFLIENSIISYAIVCGLFIQSLSILPIFNKKGGVFDEKS